MQRKNEMYVRVVYTFDEFDCFQMRPIEFVN